MVDLDADAAVAPGVRVDMFGQEFPLIWGVGGNDQRPTGTGNPGDALLIPSRARRS
jgi:hypothetical protein